MKEEKVCPSSPEEKRERQGVVKNQTIYGVGEGKKRKAVAIPRRKTFRDWGGESRLRKGPNIKSGGPSHKPAIFSKDEETSTPVKGRKEKRVDLGMGNPFPSFQKRAPLASERGREESRLGKNQRISKR